MYCLISVRLIKIHQWHVYVVGGDVELILLCGWYSRVVSTVIRSILLMIWNCKWLTLSLGKCYHGVEVVTGLVLKWGMYFYEVYTYVGLEQLQEHKGWKITWSTMCCTALSLTQFQCNNIVGVVMVKGKAKAQLCWNCEAGAVFWFGANMVLVRSLRVNFSSCLYRLKQSYLLLLL